MLASSPRASARSSGSSREGHSNATLAKMLWVTQQTVKFHLSNVYRKLGVSNRTEAARWAQLNGLLPPPNGQARARAQHRDCLRPRGRRPERTARLRAC